MEYLKAPADWLAQLKSKITNILLLDEAGGYLYADETSLLSLPVTLSSTTPIFIVEPIKNMLPLVTFGDFQDQRNRAEEEEGEEVCAICLNHLEKRHEMRELPNCSHAFHGDCLDAWMDQHHITCPTCRSNLLPKSH